MMVPVRYSLSRGHILSIADLSRVLAEISHGSRRWWIENNITLLRDPDETTFLLTVFHSNPASDQITDEISFQVPVLLSSVVRWKEGSALVCLHPETIRPLMEGLYLENGRVLGNFMEDWTMFRDLWCREGTAGAPRPTSSAWGILPLATMIVCTRDDVELALDH